MGGHQDIATRRAPPAPFDARRDGPIDDCLSIRGGVLFIEGCDSTSLAVRFGTPLYVVSEDQLRRNVRAFQAEFQRGWPDGRVVVMPSIKANYLLASQTAANIMMADAQYLIAHCT